MRTARIEFRPPPGHPPAKGNLHLSLVHMNAEHADKYEEREVTVIDNTVELELAVGSKITAEPGKFTGYWFPSLSHKTIEAGDGPQTFTLDCVPAGAIFGSITETDGSPARSVLISVAVEKKSKLQTSFLNVDVKDSSSNGDRTDRFNATPLPLGGVYRIVAHRGPSFAVSEAIAITEENPLHEVKLVIPVGQDVAGRILDENGKPLAGLRYSYSFSATPNSGFGGSDQYTDRLGRFKFEHVGPVDSERWFLNVDKNPGFRRLRLPLQFDGEMKISLKAGRIAEGRVVDRETGWPIPGVEVYALPNPHSAERGGHIDADAKTDSDGRFRFTTMDDGEYRLGVRSGNLPPGREVKVIGDQTPPVILPVTLSEWSKLKPVKPESETRAEAR